MSIQKGYKINFETKMLETNSELVMLSMGYYGKYVLPVAAATDVMRIMVQAHAAKVNADQGVYYPVQNDLKIEALDLPFVGDVPVTGDGKKSQAYLAWLKTKKTLVGNSYEPESYSVYLTSKENENENP